MRISSTSRLRKCLAALTVSLGKRLGRLSQIHRDEGGSISILTVFSVMFLAMLLGMVMNVGRYVDSKIRMQNTADAVAYSGGVVLARGMNTLAFTNYLLSEVFAVTAFLEEGEAKNAKSYVPAILAAWDKAGTALAGTNFWRFKDLGEAIPKKTPLEQRMVDTYSNWVASISEMLLPVLRDQILAQQLIPQYQRAVSQAFPTIAHSAAMEIATRNGQPEGARGKMYGMLWRANGSPVGVTDDAVDTTLPVVDPTVDQGYIGEARRQRESLARGYLNTWNQDAMFAFDEIGRMSQFGALWRGFTVAYLNELLAQYPDSNLPFMISETLRLDVDPTADRNVIALAEAEAKAKLQAHYTFVGVVYWQRSKGFEMLPGMFKNLIQADLQAYAEVHMMVPQQRLVYRNFVPGSSGDERYGSVLGEVISLGPREGGPDPSTPGADHWDVVREDVPLNWDLLNQNWTCRLAPATQPNLAEILETRPSGTGFEGVELKLPVFQDMTVDDIERLNHH